MKIEFDLDDELAEELGLRGGDDAKRALLVELFRREAISFYQLEQELGLDIQDTNRLLREHGVSHGLTVEQHLEELDALRKLRAG